MNYRHAFHAGNAADVVKHVALARIIEHLKAKPSPFRVIDLHAGAGFYDLAGEQAGRTGEWREGVGRLYRNGSCEPDPLSGEAEALLAPWRKAIAAVNDGVRLARYPGSPEIARRLVRPQDRLVFNELHPEDHAALASRFSREKSATVLRLDAWQAARALLPPPERRGLVLVDPPYEAPDEIARAVAGLAEAYRRFASGIFCLWYPVKAQAEANSLVRGFAALGIPKMLRAEVTQRRADNAERLNGSGLMLVNPPWKLEAELNVVLPALTKRLADPIAQGGGWRVDWLTSERRAKKKPDPGGRVRLGESGPA
jgi:23S rRNA (adenine2030-N6)-methyltransferase